MIQNRFHYAITGQTAPEIIYTRADHSKEHMGLQTWKNAPDGRILLSDTKVAKNYLPEKEIRQLERAVTGYFDYIEDLIERENAFNMEQFAASIGLPIVTTPSMDRAAKRLTRFGRVISWQTKT